MATPPLPIFPQTPITPVAGIHTQGINDNQLAQSVNTTINQILTWLQGNLQNTAGNAGNGYLTFPNGLIIQWAAGTVDAGIGTFNQVINLPIALTTTNYAVIVSTNQPSGTTAIGNYTMVAKTLTTVTVNAVTAVAGSTQSPTIFVIGV